MRTPTDEQRKALELVQQADAEERNRAFWWGLVSNVDKKRALMVAGMNQHRAGDPLETFTPAERACIYGHLCAHIAKMEVLKKLMGVSEVGAHQVQRTNLH